MAPSHSKVLSTELPKDLDFGGSSAKRIEKKQTDHIYSDLRNIPKLCSQNDGLKDIENDSYSRRTDSQRIGDDLKICKKLSSCHYVRKCDEEMKPDIEGQGKNEQLKSDLKVIMNAKTSNCYDGDGKLDEDHKKQSKLSRFCSIFACLRVKCRRRTKENDDSERTDSLEGDLYRKCSLKETENASAANKNRRSRKSKIVTLLVTRGPDRMRGLKETTLPYFKQQINKQTWSGGGIVSSEYNKQFDTLKNIPKTALDLIEKRDDTPLYKHNIQISIEGRNSERVNDDLNLLMEIVEESGDDKLTDENSGWEIEQILNKHFNNLSEGIDERKDDSNYSKVLPVSEIEKYLRSENEFGEERTTKDIAQDTSFNFVRTENIDNNYMENFSESSPQMYSDYASNYSYDAYKPSPLSDELLSPVSSNTTGPHFNYPNPRIVVTTSQKSNYMPASPCDKFISIQDPFVGTYDAIGSAITNPANTNTQIYNGTQIGHFVKKRTDYLHINTQNCNSNYLNDNNKFQDVKTNPQHKNTTFSMGNCAEFSEINIYTQGNVINSSPYTENGQFSPNAQNFNHYSQMTPPYSENTSPKNSPTSLNCANTKFNVNESNFTIDRNVIPSQGQDFSSHNVLSSSVLSPVSSSGHKSPDCSYASDKIPDSNIGPLEKSSECQNITETYEKSTRDVFEEAYEKLGPDMRKGICLKIHSMQENDLLNLLHAIFNDISQSNVRETMNISLFHFTCERLLMSKPTVFIEAGSKLLYKSAISCCRLPILTKYLSDCIMKAHRLLVERGLAEKDKKILFEECDIYGNTLLHRLVIQGDACLQSLAAILPKRDLTHPVLFDVEKLNSDGYSALHLACTKHGNTFSRQDFVPGEDIGPAKVGDVRSTLCMARLLLAGGAADVMYRDGKSGNTCLHLAVEAIACDSRLVEIILETSNREQRKNLVTCRNYSGSTPLELARAASKSPTRPNYPKSVIDKMKKCK